MSQILDPKNIALLLTLLVNLVLGFLIYWRDRKNLNNISYSLVVFAVILWTFGMILYRLAPDTTSLFWGKILYINATFTSSFFLLFTFIFPSGKLRLKKWQVFLIFVPNIFIILAILLPNLMIKEVIVRPGQEKLIIFGPWYLLYTLYILTYFFAGFWNLFKAYRVSSGISRVQLKYVFFGYFVSANIAFSTNLLMPWWGKTQLNWLGQVSTLIWVGFTTYAIFKHHLMNIRVIATEIFTLAIIFTLFTQIFTAPTLEARIISISILGAVSFFGYLLIRSVLQEVKYREQLQKTYEDLKVLDKAKSEFISMASHQLRTPLSAIKGYISMLLEGSYGQLSEKAKEKLANVFQSNERLLKIVNELLNISRIELGKVELTKESTQIENLIKSCYEEMKIEAEKKNLKLIWQKPKKLLPQINIDSFKIRQAILNLIDNALKYTQQGEIEIKAKKTNSFIRISVKDTGEGLTEKEQQSIFESFTRGEAGIAYWIEGVGLGLYVAKKYLGLHQGKIWAESKGKGKGSTFYIELPIK